MANNLHISYELNQQGQNYDGVIEKMKSLGSWAKIHNSYWHVNCPLSAQQVVDSIWPSMNLDGTLYVVDASNNVAAWKNISAEVSEHIKGQWPR